jgi:Asp-tRNA(Asn)/Glu-tRNA(Gln) amidotransferase B subunit
MEFEAVVGMEVHVEINSKSKVFCGCSGNFHAAPNTNVCPVCLGMPGVLPVLNVDMVNKSVAVGLCDYETVKVHHDAATIAQCDSMMDPPRSMLSTKIAA